MQNPPESGHEPNLAAPQATVSPHVRYRDIVALAELLHRQFLTVIQLELDRRGLRDINSVQALLLHNIGDSEMTVKELIWRGCYLGSNVSYNLKNMSEAGYIEQRQSDFDKRNSLVRASEKGRAIHDLLEAMNIQHSDGLMQAGLTGDGLAQCHNTLRSLNQYWTRLIDLNTRGGLGRDAP